MRFVGVLRAERAREQHGARHVGGPRFGERAGEREQDRAGRERDDFLPVAHGVAAGVDDERFRLQQRFDLGEQERAFLAVRDQARGRGGKDARCGFDFGGEGGNARVAGGVFGAGEGGGCVAACGGGAAQPE